MSIRFAVLGLAGWRRPCFSGLRQCGGHRGARCSTANSAKLAGCPFTIVISSLRQLQFITSTTYRRVPIFSTPSYCRRFVSSFRAVRAKLDFLLIGWVLMPEHFHVLVQPGLAQSTSDIVKELKQPECIRHSAGVRSRGDLPSCRALLRSFHLPPSVHDQAHYRIRQRRFVPFNVYSGKMRLEKLDYMHNNPVKRGLVSAPGEWPWSSWRFYYLEDGSLMEMDRLS